MRKKVSTERNKEIKNNVEEQSQPSPAFPRSSLNYLNLNKEDKHLVLSVKQASISVLCILKAIFRVVSTIIIPLKVAEHHDQGHRDNSGRAGI